MTTKPVDRFIDDLQRTSDAELNVEFRGRTAVARAILQARMERDWTQMELALRAETTQARICEIENRTTNARIDTISRIAAALDLEVVLQPPRLLWYRMEEAATRILCQAPVQQYEITLENDAERARARNQNLGLAA